LEIGATFDARAGTSMTAIEHRTAGSVVKGAGPEANSTLGQSDQAADALP